MSKVIVVKYSGKTEDKRLSEELYLKMLSASLEALSDSDKPETALKRYIPNGVVGMKTNCLTGKFNSTPKALTEALSALLQKAGIKENNIIIWERTNRELKNAGYVLNASFSSHRCLGTDTNGVEYSRDFYSHGQVNSLVSNIMTKMVDYNINLPVLKDHSIAGLSAGLKNMYGAIHNPNKYHDNNCDPFCAQINMLKPIYDKNKLTIIDAMKVQYHGGPGYVGNYMADYNGLLISDDPVAVDRIGLEIVEHLRQKNKMSTLEKSNRPVRYLKTAQSIGLGIADMDKIDLTVLDINSSGVISKGELF